MVTDDEATAVVQIEAGQTWVLGKGQIANQLQGRIRRQRKMTR